MKDNHIISGRSTIEKFNSQFTDSYYDIGVKNVLSNTKPEKVFTWINKTIEEKLTLILLFHKLDPVTDDSLMQYDPKNFYQIIDYIDQQRDKLNIITYSEWIKISKWVENNYN